MEFLCLVFMISTFPHFSGFFNVHIEILLEVIFLEYSCTSADIGVFEHYPLISFLKWSLCSYKNSVI